MARENRFSAVVGRYGADKYEWSQMAANKCERVQAGTEKRKRAFLIASRTANHSFNWIVPPSPPSMPSSTAMSDETSSTSPANSASSWDSNAAAIVPAFRST